jgi:hypothetical protein
MLRRMPVSSTSLASASKGGGIQILLYALLVPVIKGGLREDISGLTCLASLGIFPLHDLT